MTQDTPTVYLERLNLVAGELTPAADGRTFEVYDPSTARPYATEPDSGAADVDKAVASAKSAFATWRRTTPGERQRLLLEVAAVLERHSDELSRLEVADTGKPFAATSTEEIPPSIDQVRFFAGAARTFEGVAAAEYLRSITSAVRREPIGVCGQITPWNYPFMMAVWKWAPAVAAGNTVVLKPSEHTPSSTVRTAELASAVLPPGVLNVVCGGPATGELMARHRDVALVSITGSPRAGRAVAMAAADRLVRAHLELGGNAPVLVFADADLDEAAAAICFGAYYNAGQDCTAATRVLVDETVRARFVDALVERAESTVPGDPFEDAVDYGPLVSAAHLERVAGFIERLGAHATVLTGGRQVERPGWYFEPTVVGGVHQRDEIVQEEVFGPVVTVQSVSSESQAIQLANDVSYGLTASVFTSDHARAARCCRDLDFGAVSVNCHAPMTAEMPHGGFGRSGYGKDLAHYGLEEYTRLKHVAHAH